MNEVRLRIRTTVTRLRKQWRGSWANEQLRCVHVDEPTWTTKNGSHTSAAMLQHVWLKMALLCEVHFDCGSLLSSPLWVFFIAARIWANSAGTKLPFLGMNQVLDPTISKNLVSETGH